MVATLAETKHDVDVGHEVLVADMDDETELELPGVLAALLLAEVDE
jgi:hypothetical protein